jgi:hypothetical protein
MKELIACCWLNCSECDARIATINNDDKLRETTAEKWKGQYNNPNITAEMINCTGCRMDGAKFNHCAECEIRKCVQQRGYATCADCPEMNTCQTVGWLFNCIPATKDNLLSLKE